MKTKKKTVVLTRSDLYQLAMKEMAVADSKNEHKRYQRMLKNNRWQVAYLTRQLGKLEKALVKRKADMDFKVAAWAATKAKYAKLAIELAADVNDYYACPEFLIKKRDRLLEVRKGKTT